MLSINDDTLLLGSTVEAGDSGVLDRSFHACLD